MVSIFHRKIVDALDPKRNYQNRFVILREHIAEVEELFQADDKLQDLLRKYKQAIIAARDLATKLKNGASKSDEEKYKSYLYEAHTLALDLVIMARDDAKLAKKLT